MSMNALALAATIILLFPMFYFLVTSFAFFLRSLEHNSATFLLRGLFSVCFLAVAIIGAVGSVAFAGAGRTDIAIGIGLIAAIAIGARTWFLRRIDAQLRARDGGDTTALRRLRRLQVAGMAYNAVQFVVVVGSIPTVFPAGV
jgi:hypothetical protein